MEHDQRSLSQPVKNVEWKRQSWRPTRSLRLNASVTSRHTVTPAAFPHAVEKDDVYKGYFIPKGATVFGNAWAIHMDPMRYANPTAFDPDRFYTPGQPTPWSNGPAGARDQCVFSPSIAPCMQDR